MPADAHATDRVGTRAEQSWFFNVELLEPSGRLSLYSLRVIRWLLTTLTSAATHYSIYLSRLIPIINT
jgi:hypothetical protein